VDRGGCLDPTVIGPYGGSRSIRVEDSKEENSRTGSATGASAMEEDSRARVRV
jgi:hypothetical protein